MDEYERLEMRRNKAGKEHLDLVDICPTEYDFDAEDDN